MGMRIPYKPPRTFHKARVVAVTSGKGGVGKSNLVVNLALALAGMGQRVIIFDADLGMANAEVILGLAPRYSIYDYLYNNKDLEQIITDGPGQIKIISGGSGFLELANLTNQQTKKLQDSFARLENEADFVLVDTGAGISKNVLGFLAAADEVVVVVTPEPTSFTDAYGLIKVLSKYKVHNKIMVVVNRAENILEAIRTFNRMEFAVNRFLSSSLLFLGTVYEDKRVVQAVKRQIPFYMLQPNSRASHCVMSIAKKLLAEGKEVQGINGFIGKLLRLFG